jgi:hypothetical protein
MLHSLEEMHLVRREYPVLLDLYAFACTLRWKIAKSFCLIEACSLAKS